MLVGLSDSSLKEVKENGKMLLEACKAVKAFDCTSGFRDLEKFGEYNVSFYIYTHVYSYTFVCVFTHAFMICNRRRYIREWMVSLKLLIRM